MAIKENYLVEKRNILNEIHSNNMSLQELRFFSIYLAKINARDVSTRVVRFPIEDFQKIMGMIQVNITELRKTADNLLCTVVGVTFEDGTFERFQLFKKYRVKKYETGEWYVEIDAHDDALPLMFDFKDKYFTYDIWNALVLKSSNQLRMYELLKQYENLGERTFRLNDLKELLGLNKSNYPRYNNFKSKVLDACQAALEKYTDIKFTCEPIGKLGQGGKVMKVRFIISPNDKYEDRFSLEEFMAMQAAPAIETTAVEKKNDGGKGAVFKNEFLAFMAEACNKEFTEAEMQVLQDLFTAIMPYSMNVNRYKYQTDLYDYLKRRYDELNMQAERKEISSRFGYLKKMIESDIKAISQL